MRGEGVTRELVKEVVRAKAPYGLTICKKGFEAFIGASFLCWRVQGLVFIPALGSGYPVEFTRVFVIR